MVPVRPRRSAASLPRQTAPFEVVVLFTGIRETAVALRKAVELTGKLDACITILAPHVSPYPLPLEAPSVSLDHLRKTFESLAKDQPVEVRVVIGLCRDSGQFLQHALRPGSTVVMHVEQRWLLSRGNRTARRLRALGHNVVLV